MDPRSKNKQKSRVQAKQQPISEKKDDESKDLKNVFILLIFRDDRILLEPSISKRLAGKILKPLSIKFDESKKDRAASLLIAKYKLSGLYDLRNKIEPVGYFEIGGMKFYISSARQDRGNIHTEGAFGFVTMDEVMVKDTVYVKGSGDCTVTKSLKRALEATFVAA